ncbi:helix-turn-helix domain-containing protein [Nonomuraea sp. NPDC050556]|uniref:helix-turn-helix domain-containing protein n=1 Tax=Nonomuraea sp. NPDC050556 TaxID=3364369 RepID=UPI0037B3A3DA
MTSFQQARVDMGAQLRQLREAAGLSGKDLAERLGWQASKVSRLENARQSATDDDVAAWAQAVQAGPETLEALLQQAAAIDARRSDWRHWAGSGLAASQQDVREQEARTKLFRVFEPGVVVGLLQTAEYARHIFLSLKRLYSAPGDVDQGVQARMQRQEILYDRSRTFRFIMPETALLTKLAPSPVMQGQLDRLLAVSTLPNMELGIVPLEAQHPSVPLTGFWIFDDDQVLVPTRTKENRSRERADVEFYAGVFDDYHKVALYREEARSIIMRVNRQYAKQSEN